MANEDPTPEATEAVEADPQQPADVLDEAETGDAAAASDGAEDGTDGDGEAPLDPVAEAVRERDEYLDHLRRERAEFENFRRRSARERAEALERGAEQLATNLLGVLDNFGFVLAAAEDSADEQLSKGARMVYAELMDVLGKAGLEQITGEGEPFDPAHHEAMMQVEADEPVDAPTVAQVLRPGYRFKDRVLRPASVSVKQ
jgi:molecular chaperone GrpE